MRHQILKVRSKMKKNKILEFSKKKNRLALKIFSLFSLIIYSLAFSNVVNAACECKCISGSLKLSCKGKTDFKPICAPRICTKPKSVVPVKRKFVPPPPVVKFSDCEQRKVLNPSTNKYIWRTICRPDNSFQ